eukprot:2570338-Amphidinium_carterae.2
MSPSRTIRNKQAEAGGIFPALRISYWLHTPDGSVSYNSALCLQSQHASAMSHAGLGKRGTQTPPTHPTITQPQVQ